MAIQTAIQKQSLFNFLAGIVDWSELVGYQSNSHNTSTCAPVHDNILLKQILKF